jgi:hypothetical protein
MNRTPRPESRPGQTCRAVECSGHWIGFVDRRAEEALRKGVKAPCGRRSVDQNVEDPGRVERPLVVGLDDITGSRRRSPRLGEGATPICVPVGGLEHEHATVSPARAREHVQANLCFNGKDVIQVI